MVKHVVENLNRIAFANGGGVFGTAPLAGSGIPALAGSIASMSIPLSFVNTFSDANSGVIAPHRNSYPGIEHIHQVGVHGGTPPYYYELTNSPSGMTIQNFLTLSNGVYGGWENAGKITWQNPVAGSYTVGVKVTDSAGSVINTSFTHVCGTANWVFLNPVAVTNGIGTYADPFNTIAAMESGHTNKLCYVLAGTVPINLVNGNNNRFLIQSGSVNGLIGMPGETASIAQQSGHMNLLVDDATLSNLTVFHDNIADTGDHRCIAYNNGARVHVTDINFTNYELGTDNAENGAVISSTSAGSAKPDQLWHNIQYTGQMGCMWQSFQPTNALISCLKATNANFSQQSSSTYFGLIRFKDGQYQSTVRGCEIFDSSNSYGGFNGLIQVHGQNQLLLSDFGNTDICYNKLHRPTSSSTQQVPMHLFSNGQGTTMRNIHVYRNNIKSGVSNRAFFGGNAHPDLDDTVRVEANVVEGDDIVSQLDDPCYDITGNLSGPTVRFDANMNQLTPDGITGAEVMAA